MCTFLVYSFRVVHEDIHVLRKLTADPSPFLNTKKMCFTFLLFASC